MSSKSVAERLIANISPREKCLKSRGRKREERRRASRCALFPAYVGGKKYYSTRGDFFEIMWEVRGQFSFPPKCVFFPPPPSLHPPVHNFRFFEFRNGLAFAQGFILRALFFLAAYHNGKSLFSSAIFCSRL